MTMLLAQIFLLLLAAFLLGATTACAYRRLSHRTERAVAAAAGSAEIAASPAPVAAPSAAADRFNRALSGDADAPPHFQPTGRPVIEVQQPPIPNIPVPPQRVAVPTTPMASAPQPTATQHKKSRFGFASATAPSTPAAAELPTIIVPAAQPAPTPAAESEPAAPAPPPAAELPPASEPPAAAAAPEPEPVVAAVPEPVVAPTLPEPSESSPVAASLSSEPAAVAPPSEPAPALGGRTGSDLPKGDDLTRICSIDPETQTRLHYLGLRTYAAVAALTANDVSRISQTLGFSTRITDENWVGQAEILARGGDPGPLPTRQAAVPEESAPPEPSESADRLHRIIGIDADTEEILVRHGITRFSQIAGWIASDIENVERLLGRPGRVGLQNWVGQAKVLARGPSGSAAGFVASEPAVPASIAEVVSVSEAVDEPAPASPPPSTAEESPAAEGPAPQRADIVGLRSVRSAALRGEPIGQYTPAIGEVDDLKRIRGVGVLIEKKLNSLGITTYEQIANWTGEEVDRVSQVLDFKGRVERESWVEQARILASGGQTDFSRRADRDDGDNGR